MPPKANQRRKGGRSGDQLRNNARQRWLGTTVKTTGNANDDVPLLQWGTKNNWLTFKEKMKTACLEKFGNLGRLIEDEDYYTPPDINEDDYPDWENDDMQKYLYYDAQKSRQRNQRNARQST